MSDNDSEASVFVFYTFADNDKDKAWEYGQLPSGWWWVGAGTTAPVGAAKLEYTNEEQFSGPRAGRTKMRRYLDTYFKKLKARGLVSKYKIRNSYLP